MFGEIQLSIKILFKGSFFSYQLATLFAVSSVTSVELPAKAQQLCDVSNSASYGERASETRRTVEMSNLGIAVAIPENYRTMRLQSGAVQILHPSDFDMRQCLVRGGRGGHGMYVETIEIVEDDLTIDLEEQATWLAGYRERADDSKVPTATQVIPYEKDGLSGYIVTSELGYSASFLGVIPGRDSLLKVSAGCDCEVGVDAITDLLPNITLLD